jgi:type I restriction enzyme, S subunit
MIASLKPYPEYKESDLPWLGQVPRHWEIKRAKSIFQCIDQRSGTGKEELLTVSSAHGVVPRKSATVTMFKAASYLGYKLCWPGDLVINSLWAWAGGLGVSSHHGIISSAYGVYRIRQDAPMNPAFVHEVVRSSSFNWELQVRSKGIWISRLQLTDVSFLDAPMHIPPPSEQAAIVRFLDHANRRIERAIRAKKKLIALLNEQKQAIIHRAVTRGLDPTVPLKPSGIPWLGDIPQHWEVRRVKQTSRIFRGKFTHRPRNDPSLYDGPYPFIQTGEVARAKRFIADYTQTLNEKGLAVSKLFSSGTLVMTIAANIGDVAVLTFDACFPDSMVGFAPFKETNQDYLYFVFLCMKSELLREAPVNTQGNLNVERIGVRGVPFPPFVEQQKIVRYVEENTASFDIAITHTEREIALLREYRTRMIADVVTGKLDVREAAKNLPDEVDNIEVASEIDAEMEESDFVPMEEA